MMGKVKYFFFFLLVSAAAYALSTLFLSYLNRELVKDFSLPAPGNSLMEKKIPPPLSPAEHPKPTEKRAASLERKEDISKRTSRAQDQPGLTSLNLTLLGTVVNESGLSWAVIQDLDRDRQDMVRVGSVVAGARVVSIGRDRVVLNINGREEILLLGVDGTRSASSRGDQGAKESATSTYVLSREVVRENLENLPDFLTQARAELYYKEGKPEGFRLSQIQQGSLLRSVGFENGDVIRSVNGQEVRSLEDAIALYQKFGDSDSFTIGILRGERVRTLNVKIR
jgi:general secretion pathway protein C